MELKERLEYCRKCIKKEESATNLVCSLTHERPVFENDCADFTRDPNEPEHPLDDHFILGFGDVKENLDTETYEKLKLDQKFYLALIFGSLACIAGAIIWAVISVSTGYQIGYMALGVGALVGLTIKFLGKGFEIKFAIFGAIASLFGCLLGNLFSIIGFVSKEYEMGFWQILSTLNFSSTLGIMTQTFQFMDLIFYGIAIYEGFRFSAMRFTEKSLWFFTNKYRK